MLILARKRGEEIVIPDVNLTIRVVEVRQNGVVRLGFDAPKEVAVLRKEISEPTQQSD